MRLKLSLLLVFIITYSWSQSGSTKTFTGNGTFPVPAGVTSVTVQAWGGGGSGGGASGAPLLLGRGSAGGGGGAYASAPLLVTPGTTLNVVVASQTSGTSGAGTAGGNSTITGFETSILAAGGSGGSANNAGGSPIGGIGGSVAASAGSTKLAGANGGNGNSWNLLGLLLSSGAGGSGANSGGAGGTAVSGLILSNAPGNAGSPPGGAGSGAINSALGASQIGGAGAAGRVIISYSCANFSLTSTAATNFCASIGTTSTVTLTGNAASLPIGNYVVTYNRSSPVATALTANLTVSTAGTGTFTAVGLTTGSSTITVTKLASETCSSNITANNTATITISPATVGGTVAGGTTINAGNTSGLLTLSGHTGSVVKWQSSVSPFSVWTDLANTNTTYTSGVLTETTQFRAVVQSGSCTVVNSAATTVTVEALPTIALQSQAQGICSFNNGTTLQTTLGYTATTGTPVTYSIVWNSSPANGFTAITDAALPTSPIILYFPAATAAGIYTGTLTVKNASGSSSLGSVFNVFIDRSPSITSTGAIAWVTSSNNSQNTTLAYSASVENPTRYSIDWNSAANAALLTDQLSTLFAFSPGGGVINNIVIPANVPSGTYSGTINIMNAGSCSASRSVTISIFAAVAPTIALASSTENRCYVGSNVSQTTTLEYSGTTGSPITYSIVWNASPTNSLVPVTDAALQGSPITIAIPTGTNPGTYTGTLTVKNANGAVSTGSTFTLSLGFLATILSDGSIASVTTSSSPQTATLAYSGLSPSSGTPPTRYFIDWDQTANNALLADQPTTSFAFSFSGGSINNIVIPANVPAGTYTGAMYISNEASCNQYKNVSITVSAPVAPTIALASSAAERCPFSNITTLEYSGTTGSPITYSIVWNASPANIFAAVTDAPLPASPILIAIPVGTDSGTYTGTLTVKNADGIESLGSVFALNVKQAPSIISNDIITPVSTTTSIQYTTLAYSGIIANPTQYSLIWDQPAMQNRPMEPFTFSPAGGVIDNIIIPANVPPGTYTGIMTFFNGDCFGKHNVSIVINSQAPTIALASSAAERCSHINVAQTTTLEYSGTTGSPITYSIVWNASPA
ncbi:beta strand repeat-containing protein, partial [Flavobacterium sp.]|uniref:beta strand repeat-containing protein n=1 Tax=Flavobacterium sp. TaxID=239 RepID=UPI00374D44BF